MSVNANGREREDGGDRAPPPERNVDLGPEIRNDAGGHDLAPGLAQTPEENTRTGINTHTHTRARRINCFMCFVIKQ